MAIRDLPADLIPGPQAAPPPWQALLRNGLRDVGELCQALGLSVERLPLPVDASSPFPLRVPRGYVARMRYGDPFDPLLRQVLPLAAEREPADGFGPDPVDDRDATLTAGLLQKYPGRVLMVATGACAVHCRYCFRRHYAYAEVPHSAAAWEPALREIAAQPSIHEVILSGGDPLTIVDDRLAQLAGRLAAIPHLRRLRVHTRLPIVLPERVDDALLDWLSGTRLTPLVVVHANHPRELDESVAAALARLVDQGVPVLNQSVLLAGVNDQLDVLVELCERLVDLRVRPYYLHQLDRVAGAAHFEVPPQTGKRLIAGLRERLPGYAVPQYVEEVAHRRHKTPLA